SSAPACDRSPADERRPFERRSAAMSGRLDFETDGRDWPHRAASRFVDIDGLRIHVQVMGQGPAMLLLHGTGASSHSWRGLMALLAGRFTIIAPDLPGHGFSGDPGMNGLSLPGMARTIRQLLDQLRLEPEWGVGHSAGAAILIRMSLDGQLALKRIFSLNGALLPFGGPVGQFFAPMARMIAMWPFAADIFAWRTRDPNVIDDLLRQTGSKLDAEGVRLYRKLAGNAGHVHAALGMMANWDLPRLERDMPQLGTPLSLIVGLRDEMVKPAVAEGVRKLIPPAELVRLSGLGHLAHEENPTRVAEVIQDRAVQSSATQQRQPAHTPPERRRLPA
ncbi:MAG: alpha/beta fold hydrolase BchO, partial [Beijerinckiaceae bacterium]